MKSIGYKFKDRSLLKKALLHSSARRGESNEVFEFLGDALLGFIVAEELLKMYPEWDEGMLSRARAYLVKEESLSRAARDIELGKMLEVGKEGEKDGYRENDSILSDAFEALVAAIYLDGGMKAAKGFVKKILFKDFDENDIYDDRSRLQEIVQARYRQIPRYKVVSEDGPPHRKSFKVVVEVNGKILGEGVGRSKKVASKKAAKEAIKRLRGREEIT